MNIDAGRREQRRGVAPAHAAGEADVRADRSAPDRGSTRRASLRSKIQLTAIAPTTATRPPGIAFIQRPNTISVARTADRDGERRARGLADLLERVPELDHRAARPVGRHIGRRHAEHPAELAHRHLDPDAGQEADQDRPRDEVREEAEPRQPREEEKPAGEQRAHARQRKPLRRARLQTGDPEPGDPGEHDRGGGRVAADDEVARRTEDREDENREQDRVEARDHRRPGDLRVAHHLGNRERRERDSRDHVLRQPRPVVRTDRPEQRDVSREARRRRVGGGTHVARACYGRHVAIIRGSPNEETTPMG